MVTASETAAVRLKVIGWILSGLFTVIGGLGAWALKTASANSEKIAVHSAIEFTKDDGAKLLKEIQGLRERLIRIEEKVDGN